jgi:hypothetical protein
MGSIYNIEYDNRTTRPFYYTPLYFVEGDEQVCGQVAAMSVRLRKSVCRPGLSVIPR